MDKGNNNISKEERLDNLYLDLYKKRIEKISLEIKINNILKDITDLNIKKK